MTDDVLRVGVLGAGPIAQFAHLEACGKATGVRLHALCDTAPDLLERMAATHRPDHTFTDYDDMLADPDLDAVVVLLERFGAQCWFVDTEFASGVLGHLDLTVAVRMDWHEGLELHGEHGSIVARSFNPWYFRASEVQIFHESDATTRVPLGADGHFFRRQLEGFADTIRHGAPMRGADVDDGLASIRALAAVARSTAQDGARVVLDDVTGAV